MAAGRQLPALMLLHHLANLQVDFVPAAAAVRIAVGPVAAVDAVVAVDDAVLAVVGVAGDRVHAGVVMPAQPGLAVQDAPLAGFLADQLQVHLLAAHSGC